MARTPKSKAKSKRYDPNDAGFLGVDRDIIMRYLRVFCWFGFVGLIITGWILLKPHLQQYAIEHQPQQEVTVRLPEFPAWLQVDEIPEGVEATPEQEELVRIKQRIVREITLAAQSRVSGDPFDWQQLSEAHTALAQTGWFRDLKRVERIAPNIVEVQGEYVVPFTMVQSGAWNDLVDHEGRLLPLRYPRDFRMKSLPVIVGARFDRPKKAGERWEGKDIDAALTLVHEIMDAEWVDQIAEIDIGEFMHTETLWMTTIRGSRILWGRVPGEERGREVPARQKLAYLDWFHRNHGKVEGIYREIDLATDRVFAR